MAQKSETEENEEATLERVKLMEAEYNPAKVYDEKGRLIRWNRAPKEYLPMIKPCCGNKKHPSELQHDLVYVDKLEQFHGRLFEDLELRERAMKNWRKLRILIVLY